MAYEDHWQVTLIGNLGVTSGETFSTGFALAYPPGLGVYPLVLFDEASGIAIRDLIETFFEDPNTLISSAAQLTTIKISTILPSGLVRKDPVTGAYMQRVYNMNNVFGNGVGARHPFQVANVVSLLTTRAGRSGKGRMYLPAP